MSRILRLPALCLAIFSLATAFTLPAGADTVGSKTARPLISGPIGNASATRIPGPPNPIAKIGVDQGRISASHELNLRLVLKRSPEQQAALNRFNQQTRTLGNPNYGQTLTSAEFVETFGLAEADVDAVRNWLEYQGFKIDGVHADQDQISFHGTAAQAEQAFGTEIHLYRAPNGNQYFANAGDVRIPEALAPVVRRIDGMQNFLPDTLGRFDRPIADPSSETAVESTTRPEEFNHGWSSPLAGNLSLKEMSDARRSVRADLFEITTTTVTIAPATQVFASGTSSVITAKVAWTGAGAPTGTVSLSDSAGALNVSINLSSCTAAAGLDTCTFTWTAASGATVNSPDTITAAYGGDATFASSSGTANLALTYQNGPFLPNSSSLAASTYSVPKGSAGPVTLTFKIAGGLGLGTPTGSLMIWGSGPIDQIKEFATLSAAGCSTTGRTITCTVAWNPSALAAGSYTLEASYSGDGTFTPFNQVANATFVVTATGTTNTTTTLSANPSTVYAGGGTTFTSTTTWTGSGAAPTGSITVTPNNEFTSIGGAVFPSAGSTTSSGSGSYYFGEYTYSYACTTNTTAKTVVCTITDSDAADFLPNEPGANTVTGAYSGDSVYKPSSGTTTLTYANSNQNTSTTTVTANPTSVAYLAGTSVTYTAQVTGAFLGSRPTGTVQFSGVPVTGGSVSGTITAGNCSEPFLQYICTVTASAVVPVSVQPGTYTVTATYSGDANYAGSSGTTTLPVTGNITTTSAVSAVPTTVSPGVPSTTVTDIISWSPAQTIAPTGTVKLTCGTPSAGACGTLPAAINISSCSTLSTTSVSCSITYALDTYDTNYGAYTLVVTYSGDPNYKASSGSVTVTDVATGTKTSTTSVTATPNSVQYGAGTSVTYKATIVGSAGRGQPTGAVSFSGTTITGSPVNGNITAGNCTLSGTTYTCTVSVASVVPVATAVNTTGYTVTATYNGDTTYLASQATTTVKVTLATPTIAVSAISGAFETTVTLVATESGPTNGAAPTATPTFTVNGVTVPGTATCAASGTSGNTQSCSLNYTLPASLTAGTYTIGVSFPADSNYAAASNTGTLTVTTDTTATSVSANPTTINQSASTQLTATVSNSSVPGLVPTGSVAFSYSGGSLGSCTLSAGTCQATVQGTALAVGANTITATYSGVTNELAGSSNTTSVTVNVPACSTGQLCFSSVTHNMGSVPVGQSTAGTSNYGVQVTNKGTVAYTNLKVTLGGSSPGSFSQTNNCPASLAPNATCEIIFTFTPLATGQVTATWSVSGSSGFTYYPSNGGTLTGTGTPAGGVTLSTGGHNFGTVTDGTTSPVYGTVLTNSTASAVTLSFTTVTSPFHVTLNNCPATLAANASCNLQFDFVPTAPGITSQTFGISVNGGSTPITTGGVTVTGVKLTGTGQ